MRWILAGLTFVLGWSTAVRGQLSVQLRTERDTYLLYEAIPIVVSVRNFSGQTIELANTREQTWLGFAITDSQGSPVMALDRLEAIESQAIPAGRTVTETVNLIPHYDLRERGTYRVQARVRGKQASANSSPLTFTIVHGRELWAQTVGLKADAEEPAEYRTYALTVRRDRQQEWVYLLVTDPNRNLIYCMLPLGTILPIGEPQTRIGAGSDVHVLFRSGPRAYGYYQVDPEGEIVQRAVYSDMMSQPELIADEEGIVQVRGGEKIYPRDPRAPRPPPPAPAPAPPPKKKWWWPFGPRTPATAPPPAPPTSP